MIDTRRKTMADVGDLQRRRMLTAGIAGASLVPSCQSFKPAGAAERGKKRGEEREVGAVEDLMREHGVLRRALLVYIETVPSFASVPAASMVTRLPGRRN
jgi:hypothetical protein